MKLLVEQAAEAERALIGGAAPQRNRAVREKETVERDLDIWKEP
jgi:hypothetical protein